MMEPQREKETCSRSCSPPGSVVKNLPHIKSTSKDVDPVKGKCRDRRARVTLEVVSVEAAPLADLPHLVPFA